MPLKTKIKKVASRLIYGKPRKVYAQITYSAPNAILQGRKIVITGGGRGLGFAMAKKFVAEGADVLIAGRNEETLRQSAAELGCHYLTLDVMNVDSFEGFLQHANEILGGADTLVNNAGISLHEPSFFDVTAESFDKQIATNFRGPFFLTQAFIRYLRDAGLPGTILFTSSETGETVDCRPYGFTKAAINSMVRGLANLFAHSGIRINAIAPGVTVSDMTGRRPDGNIASGSSTIGRVYLPEEVAEAACFLISDAAGCIAGQVVACNNARTVNPRWK